MSNDVLNHKNKTNQRQDKNGKNKKKAHKRAKKDVAQRPEYLQTCHLLFLDFRMQT